MKRCILNVATGSYVGGQARLLRQISLRNAEIPLMYWRNRLPAGSPPHARVPYAFKAYAIEEARLRGEQLILWADASIIPIRSLKPLWEHLAQHGYWFALNGWNNGVWCCDAALSLLGLTREQAFEQQHVVATTFGLNLASEIGRAFAREYLRLAQAGAFAGPWRNDAGQASADPRVLGHRHDQTAASAICHRLGMRVLDVPRWFAYRRGETAETLLVCDGSYR